MAAIKPNNTFFAARGKFLVGGSVIFGNQGIIPDEDNPATLKPVYLDSALENVAQNPQPLDSDAKFQQATTGILYGTGIYSVIWFDANGLEVFRDLNFDISNPDGFLEDAPDDGFAYNRINESWQRSASSNINNRGGWTPATNYQVNDIWQASTNTWYIVLTDYISGANEDEDIASGNVQVWQQANLGTAAFLDSGTVQANLPTNADLFVDNVTALRTLTGLTDGQVIYLKGHTQIGTGGGDLIVIGDHTTEVDNNGTLFVVDGKVIERVLNGFVTLEMFGGVADYDIQSMTGTDNQQVLQSSEDYCEDSGNELKLIGRYGIGSSVIAKAITRSGIAPSETGIYALNDNHRIYTWTQSLSGGQCIFKNFLIHGYADRNTTQGDDDNRLVEVSAFDYCLFSGMEGAWSRQLGFTSRAVRTDAINNYMHHLLRDAINFTQSQFRYVSGNRIEFCADDAIACHLPPSTNENEFIYQETIITNNQIFNSGGIKALSSSVTVTGNRGQMIYGYGVNVGFDSTPGFDEGFIDKKLITISDNNFENVINNTFIGGGILGAGIWIQSSQNSNSSGVVPGNPDSSGIFVDDLPFINEFGESMPHVGNKGVTITNNNIMQTWTGGTNISDFGLGEAWTVSGFSNIAITGTLGKDGNSVFAYRFDRSMKNVVLHPGSSYGMTALLRLQSIRSVSNVSMSIGDCSRLSQIGISVGFDSGVTSLNCPSSEISGGSFDLDPLHEHSDRNTDGSWNNTGDVNGIFMNTNNVNGFVVSGVSFRNVKRIKQGTSTIKFRNNQYYYEPGKGIAATSDEVDQIQIYTDSDPTSATYGQILQGSLDNTSTVPTSGSYFIGQTVKNFSPQTPSPQFSNKNVSEFIRLTDGTGSVVGTDWGAIEVNIV